MKKILVTGADGFIGSHLTEALVRAGHDVRAFVLYNSFSSWGWLDHCGEDVRDNFVAFTADIVGKESWEGPTDTENPRRLCNDLDIRQISTTVGFDFWNQNIV